ncbi:MAG TPA: hypothetical protein VNT99_13495 [Methylomirabilota bacterium]|nr:hypothetical protein [Methylomirabilota bacterium]
MNFLSLFEGPVYHRPVLALRLSDAIVRQGRGKGKVNFQIENYES